MSRQCLCQTRPKRVMRRSKDRVLFRRNSLRQRRFTCSRPFQPCHDERAIHRGGNLIDYESPMTRIVNRSELRAYTNSHARLSGRKRRRHPQRARGLRSYRWRSACEGLSDSVWRRWKFIHYVPLFPAPYRNSFGLRNPRHGHKAISGEPRTGR